MVKIGFLFLIGSGILYSLIFFQLFIIEKFSLFSLVFILFAIGIGCLLYAVFKEKINNEEDNYYIENIEK